MKVIYAQTIIYYIVIKARNTPHTIRECKYNCRFSIHSSPVNTNEYNLKYLDVTES
jgi:hypothetical protein